MAITFKKQDDLEKMLANFATLPPLEPTPEKDKKEEKDKPKT